MTSLSGEKKTMTISNFLGWDNVFDFSNIRVKTITFQTGKVQIILKGTRLLYDLSHLHPDMYQGRRFYKVRLLPVEGLAYVPASENSEGLKEIDYISLRLAKADINSMNQHGRL